jgi:hypothetical protein
METPHNRQVGFQISKTIRCFWCTLQKNETSGMYFMAPRISFDPLFIIENETSLIPSKSCDSSVNIMLGYRLDSRGSRV